MSNEKFIELVSKLENKASKNPKQYRAKVVLLTLLGYVYVLFFTLLLLFLLGFSIFALISDGLRYGAIKLLVITGALSFFILRSLFFKVPKPEGYSIQRKDAEGLFSMLDTLQAKIKTSKIDEVILTDELNAAVTEVPRFGLFGPKQTILILGLPLLSTLNKEQFKAVLGHELAHISHADTKVGAWVYRVKRTWGSLMHSLEKNEQFGTFLFRRFFNWYYPVFDAYTFVMRRQEEYKADHVAASITSNKIKAEALIQIHISAPYYEEEFYNELFDVSLNNGSVPNPYSNYIDKIKQLPKEKKEEYLSSSLEMKTDASDTHPSLSDRLKALGIEPFIPEVINQTAFSTLINDGSSILQSFDNSWREYNEENWKIEINQYKQAKERLKELEGKDVTVFEEMRERAALTERFKGYNESIPFYEKIIEHFPPSEETSDIYLRLGEIYLEDETTTQKGMDYLKESMKLDWECKGPALDILCHYYYRIEDFENFEIIRTQLEGWNELLIQSDEEVNYLSTKDQFVFHEFDEQKLDKRITQLKEQSTIQEAYLVKKELKAIPERKQYVLGIYADMPKGVDQKIYIDELYDKFTNELYFFQHTNVVILNEDKKMTTHLKTTPQSLIYKK
jgi:Zn-dependent protease with chaperone function